MAFNWSSYLALAQELAKRERDDAALRTAVSRAYYATFHSAGLKLRIRMVPLDDQLPPHERVWKPYIQHSDDKCKAIGVLGDRLKRSRKVADYDDIVRGLDQLTVSALQIAEMVLDSLQKLPPTLP